MDNTTSHENEIEENISIDIQDPDILLSNSIGEMIDGLPALSNDCCIYRIPKRLREINEKAYTPQVVSIGPFHRGKEHFKVMEEHKLRCLQSFLNRSSMSLKSCVRVVKEWEESARSYYAETINLSRDEFVKMILLDGSFIIEAIWRYNFAFKEQTDYLNRQILMSDVTKDMILLENQLPFFVLEGLFNLAFPPEQRQSSFLKLSIDYFAALSIISNNKQSFSIYGVKHFVDLLRLCYLPSSLRSLPEESVNYVPVCNATELHEAGIKFKKGSSNRLLDITHTNIKDLAMPQLTLWDLTESLLRNLMALEQFHYPFNSYIIDYVAFMDSLIDSTKDADLLIENGIIENNIGDSSAVTSLFNNIGKEVTLWCPNYYFYNITEKLNQYCKSPWHRWKATLKHDYFSTPWRTASTIAAVILLVLTLIQTIFSIHSFR